MHPLRVSALVESIVCELTLRQTASVASFWRRVMGGTLEAAHLKYPKMAGNERELGTQIQT